MSSQLLPEFFVILGIDVFLVISLLTCLLDEHFPAAIPLVYQVAALAGYGHLLISKGFFTVFGEYMRFWYCFIYLLVALANVAAVNVYLVVPNKLWTLAKVWTCVVSLPTFVISLFFVYSYSYAQWTTFQPFLPQIVLVVSVIVAGISIGILLNRESVGALFKGETEVR